MREVADAGARVRATGGVVGVRRAVVVWRPLGAVVLHRQLVTEPGTVRVRRLRHADVEPVLAGEVAGGRVLVEREHDHVEAAGVAVEVAHRIGEERAADAGGPVDRRRVAEELVVRDHGTRRATGLGEDTEDRVHAFEHVVRPDAQRLVGRLAGELVAVVRQPVVAVVQPGERERELWPGLAHPGRPDDLARASRGAFAAFSLAVGGLRCLQPLGADCADKARQRHRSCADKTAARRMSRCRRDGEPRTHENERGSQELWLAHVPLIRQADVDGFAPTTATGTCLVNGTLRLSAAARPPFGTNISACRASSVRWSSGILRSVTNRPRCTVGRPRVEASARLSP